jgi:serine/threonine protein kinase/tetratricopeptide (TPR) repeat protein
MLYNWLTGSPPPPADSLSSVDPGDGIPRRIGHYAIAHKVGQGGMGIVYAARDDRLKRTVALKTMSTPRGDEVARQRFLREARAAASVNHPNICQIYDIGEDDGTLFIAMELLDGESLAERMRRGPLRVSEALPIARGMLAALAALHSRGLIHRDLKPANVFLTSHGVKLLDFGLARPDAELSLATGVDLTRSGVLLGTPRYMAPEQAAGQPVDARCDLFGAGAILFEMLAGRPAFEGRTVLDVLHATMHEQPPALTGSPAIVAADRVIRRALAKRPADRFASADEFAEELRELPDESSGEVPVLARALTRIVVLPFRVLRPDADTDFLAFSLPDAISTSLSGVGSLVVRSTATAAKFNAEAPDLKALATDADVDRVVMGTLLRAGDQVRATVQLVEAPDGTLLTSQTIQAPFGDLFGLQDDIARRVVDALALPLTGAPTPPPRDAPKHPRAYEFYLRGNELSRSYGTLGQARDLYLRALELDPQFAAAWAQLGRCHRVMGKFVDGAADSEAKAQEALERALSIDPDLSIAHKFYAALESDIGKAQQAIARLVRQAARHPNDPELFAGLVQACRYCGLYDEALAAHTEARRLDPNIVTSLDQTLLLVGDVERLVDPDRPVTGGGADQGIRIMGLGLANRRDEARQALVTMRDIMRLPAFHAWMDYLGAWLDRRPADMLHHLKGFSALKIQDDPEAMFLMGWLFCDAGAPDIGVTFLQRGVDNGYSAAPVLARSPHFDALRDDPTFREVLATAEAGRSRALEAFRAAGGERLLGAHPATDAAST